MEVQQITHILDNHEERIRKLEDQLNTRPTKSKKIMSIKEFILSKNAVGDVQKALVIGYYLENYTESNNFNSKDIENGFRDAKEKVPSNINATLDKNVEKGHMMQAKEKKDELKTWTLTNSGEGFVENDIEKK
ncbi:MAG: hypothetical protein HY394_02900 [Candidatus Diapherotrites archaeon]|nr:hypothetical protein [Candidatus Diapherotrites archaeon]